MNPAQTLAIAGVSFRKSPLTRSRKGGTTLSPPNGERDGARGRLIYLFLGKVS
jgi:hypothetical protein